MAKGVGFHQLKSKAEKIEREARGLKNMISVLESSKDGAVPDCSIDQIIAHYCERWKERYKHNPAITGKSVGMFKTLLKDFRGEKTKTLISAYLQMSDSFFIKKRHDVGALISSIQAVAHFAASGKVITKADAHEAEKAGKTRSLFDQIEKGTL